VQGTGLILNKLLHGRLRGQKGEDGDQDCQPSRIGEFCGGGTGQEILGELEDKRVLVIARERCPSLPPGTSFPRG